jgi:sporulation protein YlmC with PRC-barrel domain
MRNRNLITLLLTGSVALSAANMMAQRAEEAVPTPAQPPSSDKTPSYKDKEAQPAAMVPDTGANLKASTIIGQPVRNDAGERLGKLTDIIVNLGSHSAPFAIVESGGKLGLGATRIAVPLSEFKWSSESKQLLLSATKDEFQSANPAPTGGWMVVSGEDWTKHVDKYYGQPSSVDKSRFERQESTEVIGGRQPVRNPTEAKSANELLNPTPGTVPEEKNIIVTKPTDEDLMTKVNSLVRGDVGQDADNIQVTVNDGVVTLKGKATASQKQALQRNIKALPGVTRIEDNLETSKD